MTMYTRVMAAVQMLLLVLLLVLLPPNTIAAEARFGAIALDNANGLSPRYFQPASPALAKRDTACPADTHSCLDINSDLCCANSKYCVIDPSTNKAACCEIGVTCGTPCNSASYQCTATSTLASSSSSTTTFAACCGRKCPATSAFLCPSSLGGGCCKYGQTCAPNSACVSTSTASTTATDQQTTLVSMLPPGCTTSQIACAASDGGGCCSVGRVCTVVSATNYCALATVSPTGNVTAVPQDASSSDALSTGAKAGLGVGVAIAALLGAFAVYILCGKRRRRQRQQRQQRPSAMSYRPGFGGPGGSGSGGGGGGGGLGVLPRGGGITESTSDVFSRSGGGGGGGGGGAGPLRGLATDYFGPDAVVGPYTDLPGQQGSSGVSTPGRGVPMEPHGPADIVAPVEIDSVVKDPGAAAVVRAEPLPSSREEAAAVAAAVPETVDGRFELYGSEAPEQPQQLQQQQPQQQPQQLQQQPSPFSQDETPGSRGGGVGADMPTPPSERPTPLSQQQGVSPLDSGGRSRATSTADHSLPPPNRGP